MHIKLVCLIQLQFTHKFPDFSITHSTTLAQGVIGPFGSQGTLPILVQLSSPRTPRSLPLELLSTLSYYILYTYSESRRAIFIDKLAVLCLTLLVKRKALVTFNYMVCISSSNEKEKKRK